MWLSASAVLAGGSGLNTVVVINQGSTNSCELGNYFCERRQVPPENVLYINWPGSNVSWSSNQFQTTLLNPLLTMLSARQLTSQVDRVVLSMDIPYQTLNNTAVNSTTSALFYGLKSDVGPVALTMYNNYAGTELPYATVRATNGFLATMITADTLAQARQIVDQGVNSDATFPTQPVVLAKSSDPLRNVRFHAFDNAIFNVRILGRSSIQRTHSDSPFGLTNLLGYETGLAGFNVSPGTFVPGAIADSLTSFGGIILAPNGQTTLLAFINAGAAGSYGTVTEPSPNPSKFPDPQVYFYQARGFSLDESFYQSLLIPYQGLIVGEPLAAPFARFASGQWIGVVANAVLSGTAPLTVRFSAADSEHPLQQIALYVDGKYFQVLTNLAPAPGNVLNLALGGHALAFTVSANSTIASVAGGLAGAINLWAGTNSLYVTAAAAGDRVELRSLYATNRLAPPTNLRLFAGLLTNPTNPPAHPYPRIAGSAAGGTEPLTTFLHASRNNFLTSPAQGSKACDVNGGVTAGTWLRLTLNKTNGASISVSVTNQLPISTPVNLVTQFIAAVNSEPLLQGAGGVTAEDFAQGWFSDGQFTLRARAPGQAAAAVKVLLTGPASLSLSPAVVTTLEDNLPDLQARAHLYVTAGATNLAVTFPFDTRALANGYHELTAVAIEGSHVQTQTRVVAAVRVQNTALTATLNLPDLPDLPDSAPVQGTYHVQVTANATNVSTVRLFSTGGIIGAATNQAAPTFSVSGTTLGAGLHPFYAVVETPAGAKYRTETRWVRFTN